MVSRGRARGQSLKVVSDIKGRGWPKGAGEYRDAVVFKGRGRKGLGLQVGGARCQKGGFLG